MDELATMDGFIGEVVTMDNRMSFVLIVYNIPRKYDGIYCSYLRF